MVVSPPPSGWIEVAFASSWGGGLGAAWQSTPKFRTLTQPYAKPSPSAAGWESPEGPRAKISIQSARAGAPSERPDESATAPEQACRADTSVPALRLLPLLTERPCWQRVRST